MPRDGSSLEPMVTIDDVSKIVSVLPGVAEEERKDHPGLLAWSVAGRGLAWERTYSGNRGRLPSEKPSPVARKAQRRLQGSGRGGGTVIDVGALDLKLADSRLANHATDLGVRSQKREVASNNLSD